VADLPDFRETVEAIIDEMAAAQEKDGYLYLNLLFGPDEPYERFSRLDRPTNFTVPGTSSRQESRTIAPPANASDHW